MKAAVKNQPISVAIAANSIYIHSYASGVIDALGAGVAGWQEGDAVVVLPGVSCGSRSAYSRLEDAGGMACDTPRHHAAGAG